MAWLGYATTSFHHSTEPVTVVSNTGEKKSILEICEDAIPPCNLSPWLFNGHLQSIWAASRRDNVPIFYERRVFEAAEPQYPGTFAVDFVVEPNESNIEPTLPARTTYMSNQKFIEFGSLDNKPMVLVTHSLSGGSYELHVRQIIAHLKTQGDWECCVLNMRGCAKSDITSNWLYNGAATWDLRQTVAWLRKNFPQRPLFAVGISLGANILTNYIAEEGAQCLLKAAVVCSNPWNLDVSSQVLQNTWIGSEIYSRAMAGSLKKYVESHSAAIEKYTTVSLAEVRKVTYLKEFDRLVTAPLSGYPTPDSYYRDASCVDSLLGVKIPFLAINALDDPIAGEPLIPFHGFEVNPFTVLCTTSLGGHMGWIESGGTRWFPQPIANFLNSMLKNTVTLKPSEAEAQLASNASPFGKPWQYDSTRRKLYTKVS